MKVISIYKLAEWARERLIKKDKFLVYHFHYRIQIRRGDLLIETHKPESTRESEGNTLN